MPTTDNHPARSLLSRRPVDADPPTLAEVLDEHPELWAGLPEERQRWIVAVIRERVGRRHTRGRNGY